MSGKKNATKWKKKVKNRSSGLTLSGITCYEDKQCNGAGAKEREIERARESETERARERESER